MRAAERMGSGAAVVTHPGSHRGEGEEPGMQRVIRALEKALSPGGEKIPLLLETSSGAGDSIGHDFGQLGRMIDELRGKREVGVCLDTCHVFAAGYHLSSNAGIEETLDEFDLEVGLRRLMMVHANDSKGDRGSRLDRHEHLGKGKIGLPAFRYMVNHPALRDLPWILETPGMTLEMDSRSISLIRSLPEEDVLSRRASGKNP